MYVSNWNVQCNIGALTNFVSMLTLLLTNSARSFIPYKPSPEPLGLELGSKPFPHLLLQQPNGAQFDGYLHLFHLHQRISTHLNSFLYYSVNNRFNITIKTGIFIGSIYDFNPIIFFKLFKI